jgi:hypothetical protein
VRYLCIRGVYALQAYTSSVTTMFVTTIRKFVSVVLSIALFQNPFTTSHCLPAQCAF